MRANLDGSLKTTLVKDGGIHTPNGVALDYERELVYWVDGRSDTLEMVGYNGRWVWLGVWLTHVHTHLFSFGVRMDMF